MKLLDLENRVYDTIARCRMFLVSPAASALSCLGLSSDSASALKALLGISAACFLLRSHNIAILCYVVSVILDSLDGAIARNRQLPATEWGVFVDIATDLLISLGFLFSAVSFGFVSPLVAIWFACITIAQWPLGTLRVSNVVRRPTCEMGLLRQLPKYGLPIVSLIEPRILYWYVLVSSFVITFDCTVLVCRAKSILSSWRVAPLA